MVVVAVLLIPSILGNCHAHTVIEMQKITGGRTMSETKLLSCPFCGGEAELIGHYIKGVANNYQYFVRCKQCKARPQSFNTFKKPEKAIEVWNTRKPMERIVENLEEYQNESIHEVNSGFIDVCIDIVKEEGGIC
jgi:Lar family restriction alleviation protein